jgi:hypothetical protein
MEGEQDNAPFGVCVLLREDWTGPPPTVSIC